MRTRMVDEFAPATRLDNQMNRLLEGFFEDVPAQRSHGASYPGINVWQDGDVAWIETELPGVPMCDIEVLVSGSEVTIAGERKIQGMPGDTYHRRERGTGRFSRSLTLPWMVESKKVEAKLRDGVLLISLPRSEACKPRKVEVLNA